MIQNVLTRIGGVSAYGIISICIFFTFFLGLVAWACSRKKDYLQSMSTLPLNGGERDPKTSTETNPQSELP